jgi:hypothetical protein
LRLLKDLIFFGKRDLAFGINLLERSEIWKTFLGASDGRYSRHAACRYAPCFAATYCPVLSVHPNSLFRILPDMFDKKVGEDANLGGQPVCVPKTQTRT